MGECSFGLKDKTPTYVSDSSLDSIVGVTQNYFYLWLEDSGGHGPSTHSGNANSVSSSNIFEIQFAEFPGVTFYGHKQGGVDLSGSYGTYDGGLVASTGTKFSTSTWQRPPAQLVEYDEAPFTGTVGTYTVNYLSSSSDTSDHIVFGSINEVVNSAYTSSANYRGDILVTPLDKQMVLISTVKRLLLLIQLIILMHILGLGRQTISQLLPVLCKI